MRPPIATSPTSSLPGTTSRPVCSSTTRIRSFTVNRAGAIVSSAARAEFRGPRPSDAPSESTMVSVGEVREEARA